ncbi:peptidase inhibitor i9 domain-containing protein [Rhizoctonia solani AG-1 IA]|uniref:Peptidase inhibitor i9 domain-containing protein n=1 Tax=Thanatephorus cucumeris (strain AG1-IA) TaxID=983506 RepID=L8WYE2_THACA|nr:peptidase inhibitor i9 domain-containing protein [Rhizoctonia solani AG-1 IA]
MPALGLHPNARPHAQCAFLNNCSWIIHVTRAVRLSLRSIANIVLPTMKDYIVMFTEAASKGDIENYKHRVQESAGGSIKYHYDIIKGIAITMPDDHVQSFANDPIVSTMESDGVATIQN